MSRLRSIGNSAPALREFSTIFSACFSACRSDPQIPHASVFTSTSPVPGAGVGILSTTSFLSRIIAARIIVLLLHRYCIRVDHSLVKPPALAQVTVACICTATVICRDGPQDSFHHYRSAALRFARLQRWQYRAHAGGGLARGSRPQLSARLQSEHGLYARAFDDDHWSVRTHARRVR